MRGEGREPLILGVKEVGLDGPVFNLLILAMFPGYNQSFFSLVCE